MTVQIHVRGRIGDDERECAQAMIGAVLRHHEQAELARVRLAGSNCPDGPALIQVNLRVCGAPARVQVAGNTVTGTIAACAARLHRQIRRLSTAWEPWPWPDPERRTLGVPGPGEVVRRKAFRLHVGTPCLANAAMEAMDYDVYLYTDAGTGEDAVVYRAGPTGVRLARQHSMHPPAMPAPLPLTVNPRRTPRLTIAQAAQRLAAGWLPHLFYTDRDSGRGNLLYRRYDGQLGLIVPAHNGGTMSDESVRHVVPTAAGARRMVELDRAEALKLLGSVPFGRVVFTRDALPAVRPVNHLVDGQRIIIRTRLRAKLTGAAEAGTVVAYEADDLDPIRRLGWSVVATGIARPVADPDEVARYERQLRPWVNLEMGTVIAIDAEIVTGFRLVATA